AVLAGMRGTSMRNATHPLSSLRKRAYLSLRTRSDVALHRRVSAEAMTEEALMHSLARFALILVALTTAALSTPAVAADKLRVGKAVPEAFSFVPPDVGMRNGIFQKNNTELELTAFAGDARMQQAAAADSIDVLLGSGPAMAFIAKGAPIK